MDGALANQMIAYGTTPMTWYVDPLAQALNLARQTGSNAVPYGNVPGNERFSVVLGSFLIPIRVSCLAKAFRVIGYAQTFSNTASYMGCGHYQYQRKTN